MAKYRKPIATTTPLVVIPALIPHTHAEVRAEYEATHDQA